MKVRYNLTGASLPAGISVEFAVRHMVNIAWEFGVLLQVEKVDPATAPGCQPVAEYGPGRFT